jgi:cytochrome P450/ferredoxin-NADP reductase
MRNSISKKPIAKPSHQGAAMSTNSSTCPFDHPGDAARAPNGCPVSARAAAFDPFDPAYMLAPTEYLRWALEQEPVFYSPRLGYWVVTRYDDVKAVFRDNILFSPAVALEKITPATNEAQRILDGYGYAMQRTMVNEDEPWHMERRRLLMDAFLPDRLMRLEPQVRALTREAMDRFVDDGKADLVAQLFHRVPLAVALKFLGVPDEDAQELHRFTVAHTLNTWGRPTPQQQVEIAHNVGRFWQTAQRILEKMRANPDGEGWMYDSIRAHLRHPDVVPESYLRSMMMAILAAAHETTTRASTNAFLILLTQRQAWEDICANPDLIPNAVEECLRLSGSIIAWRRIATDDAEVGGVKIPKGARLLIVQATANRDPRHFENPDELDVYRENAVEHLTFGYGAHQCMGKNIGRLQMRVFLEEFVRRLPHIELVPRQALEYLPNTSFRGPSQLWVQWDPARNPERGRALPDRVGQDFYIGPPVKAAISRTVVLRERHEEGEDLVRLVLADPRGRELPAWSAGAHVDLISGGVRRKYSLCGEAGDRRALQVVVQREADGRGGSRHFCDVLRVGDVLQLAGPKNQFRLDEGARRYVLVAGGIGITPILAMADRLKALGRPYELHYAGRSRRRMALLARLERDHGAHLHLYVKDEGRRMPLPQVLAAVQAEDRVYVCGPTRLIEEAEALAVGWPGGVLHYEHFSGDGNGLDPDKEHPFTVWLKDSQLELTVPRDQTLLQVLQAAGIDVPCDCGEGLCGTCEVVVVEGEVDHRDKVLSRAERADGRRMMACCSRAARDRLTLAL